MADMNKFEEMLERLINEDRQGAEELFHDIVVEKSRSIYESLLDDEESEYDFEEAEDVGGDATDDLMRDLGLEDEDDSEEDSDVDMDLDVDAEGEDDEEMEDRVEDLEDALDDLRAEFEKLMADEDGEEDSEEDEEWDDESEESDEEDSEEDEDGEQMREYVEKVAPAKMGDSGSNTKSAVAGKNDMGGTTDNIARGDTADDGNKVKQPKTHDAGNVNKPGAKASKSLKSQSKGHGAEKKGAGEGADNKTSTVGSKKQK